MTGPVKLSDALSARTSALNAYAQASELLKQVTGFFEKGFVTHEQVQDFVSGVSTLRQRFDAADELVFDVLRYGGIPPLMQYESIDIVDAGAPDIPDDYLYWFEDDKPRFRISPPRLEPPKSKRGSRRQHRHIHEARIVLTGVKSGNIRTKYAALRRRYPDGEYKSNPDTVRTLRIMRALEDE